MLVVASKLAREKSSRQMFSNRQYGGHLNCIPDKDSQNYLAIHGKKVGPVLTTGIQVFAASSREKSPLIWHEQFDPLGDFDKNELFATYIFVCFGDVKLKSNVKDTINNKYIRIGSERDVACLKNRLEILQLKMRKKLIACIFKLKKIK